MTNEYLFERDWANREKADLVKHIRNDGNYGFFQTEVLADAMDNDLVEKEELWEIYTELKDEYEDSLNSIDDSYLDDSYDCDSDYYD